MIEITTPRRGAPLRRRTVLAASLAGMGGLLLSGCQAPEVGPVDVPATLGSLVRDRPFYIAHRGGGGDWPEMTAYAYEQCMKLPGLAAVEMSVCLSEDGVLVCSHDPDTLRTTGRNYVIADETWATLSTLKVSAAGTTDPKQPARPLSRFEDVIDMIVDDYVLFVEPKVSPAGAPLMRKLVALDQPQRVVWKQPVNSTLFREAKAHGFGTWGYVLNEPAHLGENLTRLAADASVDMLGAPLAESDDIIESVVSAARGNGKPVVAQTVRRSDDRVRALRLGCAGLMTSTITQMWATRAEAAVEAR